MKHHKLKLFRTSTIPLSLNILLKGQLSFLSEYFDVTAISGQGKELDEVGEREGVKTIALEMQRQISPIKDFISLVKLYLLFKKDRPQIVHSITPKAGLLTMLAGKLAGVPIRMHTFTGLIFPSKTGFMQKLLMWMDRLLCWSATHIYPEGEGVKKDLIEYKITNKPLKVIANGNVNGIDVDFFSSQHFSEKEKITLREQIGIDQGDFVFVFVGRLVGDKGINELVKAFVQLQKEYKGKTCKLLLVGGEERELDPLLPETIVEIDTNENIISVGFQKDVRPYFAISDVLVFPSYREGFPNVVMQAGAMGVASIVSDINGCNEIIINGENGYIIPPKNVERLKDEMKKILDYDDLLLMKSKSREMIVSRYQRELVWNELLKEYQKLHSENV